MTDLRSIREPALRMRLLDAGFSEAAAEELAARFREVLGALPDSAEEPRSALFVPGRIEVLGKHTDYAGGSSLTCATERGFCLAVTPSSDPALRVRRLREGETVSLDLTASDPDLERGWLRYPWAVVRRVREDFGLELSGGHLAFVSTLPQAAGLSSSSAMVVAVFEALRVLNDLHEEPLFREHLGTPESRAAYLGAIENGQPFGPFSGGSGVGTAGGSEDHTAILCSAPGRLRQFSYRPTRQRADVPVPEGRVFVIADSGVVAEKTGGVQDVYNRASRLASRAAALWREATGRDDPHLGAIAQSDAFSMDRMRKILREAADSDGADGLVRRVEHFVTEHAEILPKATHALRGGDLEAFGNAVDRSQAAAETLLGNQVPETSFLAGSARDLGARAASAFGAGFGGSVWALVPEGEVAAFQEEWARRYEGEFPERAESGRFFLERTGPAALEL